MTWERLEVLLYYVAHDKKQMKINTAMHLSTKENDKQKSVQVDINEITVMNGLNT